MAFLTRSNWARLNSSSVAGSAETNGQTPCSAACAEERNGSAPPKQCMDTHDPRRLLLEEEWRREAVKRGKAAAKQVKFGMIHPVRSSDPDILRELEQRREELYRTPNSERLAMEVKKLQDAVLYTREEVEQRQEDLYWGKFEAGVLFHEGQSSPRTHLHEGVHGRRAIDDGTAAEPLAPYRALCVRSFRAHQN